MPKNLLLIRHAKSSWDDLLMSDFQRPLNERGLKNAPEMAQRLINRNLNPQQLISSPAIRALKTAEIFASKLNIKASEIIHEAGIYEAQTKELLAVINKLDDSSEFTAIFGHNPGLSSLANYLCEEVALNLPTCGMILLTFPYNEWQMLSRDTGKLVFFDFPKNNLP